ncbi:ABC transporter ATP-binding protein [Aquabacter sp. CN5-332]|uniref:ABC transporter ATP-binding protein n=1 Tax=Aquabacter sp. CN5-332 TaxID=3156608 RepID=UPI0032B43135
MVRRLEARDLVVNYGEVPGVKGISLHVEQGEIIALLGANGAGKSTTLKAFMGMVRSKSGAILLDGADVTGEPAYTAPRRGVALVPEGRRIFKRMTVKENLEVGGVTRSASERPALLAQVYTMFPRLQERSTQLAGTLSGGEQQMLAIGRALMAKPDFILFDEPSLGLAPLVTASVMDAVRRISSEFGVGAILVEQNVEVALDVASRAYVLCRGQIALEGESDAVRVDPALRQAYLGMSH